MIIVKKVIVIVLALLPTSVFAHQPVMDMAPRWEKGYGFQCRYEQQNKETFFQEGLKVSNLQGLKSNTSTLWVEGVYTFTRERRLSIKIPYISTSETLATSLATTEEVNNTGLGGVIVGFLNKWYFNKPGLTGNVSFTPSLKLPWGKSGGDSAIGTGTVDFGLSVSASIETFYLYGLWDVFTWVYSKQETGIQKGAVLGFDSDWGIHPYHDMLNNMGFFAMFSLNAKHYNQDSGPGSISSHSGSQIIEAGPVLVLYKDNIMMRGHYYIPVYSNVRGNQLAFSSRIQLGVGIAFD